VVAAGFKYKIVQLHEVVVISREEHAIRPNAQSQVNRIVFTRHVHILWDLHVGACSCQETPQDI
jgi:hypothetical protein